MKIACAKHSGRQTQSHKVSHAIENAHMEEENRMDYTSCLLVSRQTTLRATSQTGSYGCLCHDYLVYC